MSSSSSSSSYTKPCNVALPLYISVVEFGKQRLLECLTFLFAAARPGALKLCYSQIDCAILAIAGSTLDAAIDPANRSSFEREKKHFFTTRGTPGCLKEEWLVSTLDFPGGWKFASPYMCCYALVPATRNEEEEEDDRPGDGLPARKKIKSEAAAPAAAAAEAAAAAAASGHAKASSFNNLSTAGTYRLACNALDRVNMQIEQERRTNKMLNTKRDTVKINIPFANNNNNNNNNNGSNKNSYNS
jgi:hypothetical protein